MESINHDNYINEKLKRFTEIALKEAYDQRKQILEAAETKNNEIKKNKELLILQEAYNSIQVVTRTLRKELNESVSKALVDGKRQLFEKRKEIIESVFLKVGEKLFDFRKTNDYREYIEKNLKECMRVIDDTQYRIVMNEDERTKFSEILHMDIKSSDEDILGGFIIYGIGKRLMIDFSFKAKVQKARKDFIEFCNLPIEDGDLTEI